MKQCIRHGIDIIYHASFIDEEGLDMLEAAKDKHFVAPGIAWLINTSLHAASGASRRRRRGRWAITASSRSPCESLKKMHKRGIRILPGGDYGFAWIKHGTNAKDLEYFVKYLGFTPMEALQSATRLGGEIMMRGKELGQVKEGFLADLLLVDGDPLVEHRACCRTRTKLLAIMKDGVFHKEPETQAARGRRALSVA